MGVPCTALPVDTAEGKESLQCVFEQSGTGQVITYDRVK